MNRLVNIYFVTNGQVAEVLSLTPWYGTKSVLIAAQDEKEALETANDYNNGLVQADKMVCQGKTISIVRSIRT